MVLFKPLLRLGVLFMLTALLCFALVECLQSNPLCSLGFLFAGTLAVILTVDAL